MNLAKYSRIFCIRSNDFGKGGKYLSTVTSHPHLCMLSPRTLVTVTYKRVEKFPGYIVSEKQSVGWRSPCTIVCVTRMSFLPDLIATIVFPSLRPFPSLLFCNTFIIYCPDYPPLLSHGRIQADSTTVFSQNCSRLPMSCRDAANSEHVFQTITGINYPFTHAYVCYVCIRFIRFKNTKQKLRFICTVNAAY